MNTSLRTSVIENAITDLSTIPNLDIMDVRKYLDKATSKKVATGKKIKYTDPNGDEHECDEMAPISKFYNYVPDEKEIYIKALEKGINDKTFFHELSNETKISEVLKWARANANFVAKDSIWKFCNWLTSTIADIKKTSSIGDVDRTYHDDSQLIINSVVKGSGKSTFIDKLINAAKEADIEAKAEVALPEGTFYNSKEESRNLLIGYRERKDQKVDETTLQNIGRREIYSYCEKGKMPIGLRSRAITISSTNGNPYCSEDRAFLEIQCLPVNYKQRMRILQTFYKLSTNFENDVTLCGAKIYNMDTEKFVKFVSFFNLLEEKNNNKYENNSKKQTNFLNFSGIKYIYLLKGLLQDCPNQIEKLHFTSVAGFCKWYRANTAKDLTWNQQKALAECFTSLLSFGFVKARGPKDDFRRQYDLFSIRDAILEYEETDSEGMTIEDEVKEAMNEWDRIIKAVEEWENNNTDPEKSKFLKETDETLPEGYSFCNKYDKEATFENNMQEQVVINKSITGQPSRKGSEVEASNFLLECDDVSKEEQMQMIENLPEDFKKCILYVCDSGNKSIHTVLYTNCKSTDSRVRRSIMQHLNKHYFKNHLDMNTVNASRLARNPNAIRDNGKKQQCYYMKLNPSAFDVSFIEQKVLKEMADERAKWEYNKLINASLHYRSNYKKKELTVETLKTFKQTNGNLKAQEMLEGTCDWAGMVTACMYLLNFWDADEIEAAVGSDDKWIKNALKTAERRM